MIIESLAIKNFRNYESLETKFEKGLNIILGHNGTGKTNLVEAIYYLSFARSFRTMAHQELIKHNKEFAVIEAKLKIDEEDKRIRIVISNEGQKITYNGSEIAKLSELVSHFNALVFEPRDVMIFQASPRIRRSYLNMQISKLFNKYLQISSQCAKLTKERNYVLKDANYNKVYLEVVTNQIIELSYDICRARKQFLKQIEPIVNKILKEISFVDRQIKFKYQSFVEFESKEEFIERAQKAFNDSLETDLKRKATTIGVHHEDFLTSLNDGGIAECGSQGEKRMVAIALKLAPYFLIKEKEKKPVVVLDDVFSELDATHQDKLIKFLKKFNQVFITGTEINAKYDAAIYDVANLNVVRRNTRGR